MTRILTAATALALLALPPAAAAATLTWPNLFGAGCTGTLQACLDSAAPGDTVQIGADDPIFPDRYTTIDETVSIFRSVTLRAAPGIDAVFADGRFVNVVTNGAAAADIRISDLVFTRGGVFVEHNASSASTYRAERLRFNDVSELCAIEMQAAAGAATASFQAGDNVIGILPGAGGRRNGICMLNNAAGRQDVVYRNRIVPAPDALNAGIVANGNAGGPITVQGNSVLGERFVYGILIGGSGLNARYAVQLDDNVVSGQRVDGATLGAGVAINTENADVVVVNNTVVDGTYGISLLRASSATPSVAGRVANNVVAQHRAVGLYIDPAIEAAGVTNRNNLVYANAANAFTAGPGTRTGDPRLISLRFPRLRDDSPAINAGDNASIPAFSSFDADGERRIVLGTVDIGAYEANAELAGVETTDAISATGNIARIVRTQPLVQTSQLQVTPHRRAAAGLTLRENLGVYLPNGATSDWYAYFEDPFVNMPVGYRFSVLAPAGSKTSFTHVTTLANVVDDTTQLASAELDSRPFAIAAVTHLYQLPGGPASYHDHPLGLEYFGSRWYVRNQDLSEMQANRNFNVVVAPVGSPNAFRARTPFASGELRLDHPLLDDNACAAPIASRLDDPDVAGFQVNAQPFTLDYRPGFAGSPGRWFIVADGDGSPTFPANSAFNVIVDGQQANRCRAPVADFMFRDSFE